MAYNEKMADRVRELIASATKKVEEKRIFGGLCFMVKDKMCVGVKEDHIMVRLDPDLSEKVLEKEGASPMVHSGKVMKGFVFVNEYALRTSKQLEYWVTLALDFNQFAKSSKPSKSKQPKTGMPKSNTKTVKPAERKKPAAAKNMVKDKAQKARKK